MASSKNNIEMSFLLGEAAFELLQHNREINRETLALAIKNRAEQEPDDDKLLFYWQACNALKHPEEAVQAFALEEP
ncbi:hypothetical protein TUM12370_20130 [Salmonella enterica subsp. enterica serovar Choleraesuis]|nr:hypothetical protein TUM12370_20130 [Salmonella enterica subsp. enterica serovar Choleraesuis]